MNKFSRSKAFGASADVLEHCAPRGISIWGAPISEILSNGDLLIKEALAAEPSGLVSVLLEGNLINLITAFELVYSRTSNRIGVFRSA